MKFTCLLLILSFGLYIIPKKFFKLYGLLSSLLLSWLAFHINVPISSDLYRHIEEINYYKLYGFDFAIDTGRINRNPLTVFMYYVFSFFEDTRWFQAIIIFIIYELIFLLIDNISVYEKKDMRWIRMCTTFALLTFNFYQAVYGVRMWIVFVIFIFCLYQEMVKQKYRLLCYCIYISLIFFHYAAIILIISRIFAFIFSQSYKTKKRIFYNIIYILIIIFIFLIILKNSNLIETIIVKFDGYAQYEVRGLWQTINSRFKILTVTIIAVFMRKNSKEGRTKECCLVCIFIFLIVLIFIGNYQVTLRFADCLVILICTFFPEFPVQKQKNNMIYCTELKISIYRIILIASIFVNLIYVTIFDYNNLQFLF